MWTQRLSGSQLLEDADIEEILTIIGARGFRDSLWSREMWGWASECDVRRTAPDRTLEFGGLYHSRASTLPSRFAAEAKRRGFDVHLDPRVF
jgi:hypothetical protein